MELRIVTPGGVHLNLQIDKASFPGTQGSFTVMNNHAPFISSLKEGKIRYRATGKTEEQEVEIDDGIVKIERNKIWVFTEQYPLNKK